MRAGEIDIYPEYTGTALTAILKLPVDQDADSVLGTVSQAYREKVSGRVDAAVRFQ